GGPIKRATVRLIRFIAREMGQLLSWVHALDSRPIRLVDRHISKISQGAGAAVFGTIDLGQIRIFIYEIRSNVTFDKLRIIEYIHQKRDIRRHAPNSELR